MHQMSFMFTNCLYYHYHYFIINYFTLLIFFQVSSFVAPILTMFPRLNCHLIYCFYWFAFTRDSKGI